MPDYTHASNSPAPVFAEMTVGKDMDVTIKSKGAGGQGKVAASVVAPSGKPVASKVETGTERVCEPRLSE